MCSDRSACIIMAKRCDGKPDCQDGSDERGEPCGGSMYKLPYLLYSNIYTVISIQGQVYKKKVIQLWCMNVIFA